ncbi:NAD synthetase [bacterium]|nr:MAG: NAD synthetase [bacterium]RKZ13957.1 MAG: NAD synthetase [bacterium]
MNLLFPLAYLVAAIMFIQGIRRLSKVRTAKSGNTLSAFAMLIAIVVTMVLVSGQAAWPFVLGGMVVGSLIGLVAARRVEMTEMPELVALFNGFGGGASALVSLALFFAMFSNHGSGDFSLVGGPGAPITTSSSAVSAILGLIIGAITLSGSYVAFLKLNGTVQGNAFSFSGRNLVNGILLIAPLLAGLALCFVAFDPGVALIVMLAITVLALIVGVTATLPIGGADMPVVISLLNSLSGVAAAMAGFAVQNPLLIVAGSLVGASGLILTQIMCKAMNRTLAGVLFKSFGSTSGGREGYDNVKESSAEEVAMLLDDAERVVFVPGYGLAVAQAQHVTRELATLLEARGVEVAYAIHPVAGRMPGHMNVLLAEADVPYEQLQEMDKINPEFKTTDVSIVLGANDVVNPAALSDKESPIYGMPILNVHESRTVVVIKRSLSPGFAGIRNELFDYDNTVMVFGDAKKVLTDMVAEVKENA